MEVCVNKKSLDWRLDEGYAKLACNAFALRVFSNSYHKEMIIFNSDGVHLPGDILSNCRLCINDILRADITDKYGARLNYNNMALRYYPRQMSDSELHKYEADTEIAVLVLDKGTFLKGDKDILSRHNIRLA